MKRMSYTIGMACMMAVCCLSGAYAQRSGGRSIESSRSNQQQEQRHEVSREAEPVRGNSSRVATERRSASVTDRSSRGRGNSSVQERGASATRNSNATVVERNRHTTSQSSGVRGGDNAGRSVALKRDDPRTTARPHAQYSRHTPPPRGYHRNNHPPHGYHFVAPPHGHGCPRDYRFNTPPPRRAPRYTLGGTIYYYYDCCYHTLINGVYQVVAAPFGLSILALPHGHTTIVVNNQYYYYYDGAYYRNYGTHYEVVHPIVGMIVPYLPNYGVSYVYYNGQPAYYYNGYYYYEYPVRDGVAFRVVGQYNPY